ARPLSDLLSFPTRRSSDLMITMVNLRDLSAKVTPDHARLSTLVEFPELAGALPESQPLPDIFEKSFLAIGITRIRRGLLDVTMRSEEHTSELQSLRHLVCR